MPKPPATPRLAARILDELVTGAVPGTRLPGMRALSARYGASPVTVHAAVQHLVRSGRLVARPGDGTYVAAPRATAVERDYGWQSAALGPAPAAGDALGELLRMPGSDTIHLGSGYPDETLLPESLLRLATHRVSRRPGAWGRAPSAGLDELRAWFAGHIGGEVRPHEVAVAPGGQAALSAAFRALQPPGAPVLVESPTWIGALAAARGAGHTVVPVPADRDGVRPDLLADALRRTGARLVYLQPLHANPTGAVLAVERRAAVLQAVRDADAFLVEDDFARSLGHGPGDTAPPPLLAEDDGHVIHIRSLTKTTAPSLRIAALVARGPAAARLRTARLVEELFTSRFLQEVALDVVTNSAYTVHLRRLSDTLRERAAVLVPRLRALGLHVDGPPRGGFSVWAGLPDGLDEDEVVRGCAAKGVVVNGGRAWFPAEPTGGWLRLSVAGATTEQIGEGVGRLERVLTAASRA